jgi:hypothetical protein
VEKEGMFLDDCSLHNRYFLSKEDIEGFIEKYNIRHHHRHKKITFQDFIDSLYGGVCIIVDTNYMLSNHFVKDIDLTDFFYDFLLKEIGCPENKLKLVGVLSYEVF